MRTVLDWSAAEHWSHDADKCIWCDRLTNLRDPAGRPAHKACAERRIDELRRARRPLRAVS